MTRPWTWMEENFFSFFFLSNSQKSKVIGKARMKIDVAVSDGVVVR